MQILNVQGGKNMFSKTARWGAGAAAIPAATTAQARSSASSGDSRETSR